MKLQAIPAIAISGAVLLTSIVWGGSDAAAAPLCPGTDTQYTQPVGQYFTGADGTMYVCVDVGEPHGKWVRLPRGLPNPGAIESVTSTTTPTTIRTTQTPQETTTPTLAPAGAGADTSDWPIGKAVGAGLSGLAVMGLGTLGLVKAARAGRTRRATFIGRGGIYDFEEDLGPKRYWPGTVSLPMQEVLDEVGATGVRLSSRLELGDSTVLRVSAEDEGRISVNGEPATGETALPAEAVIEIDATLKLGYSEEDNDDERTD